MLLEQDDSKEINNEPLAVATCITETGLLDNLDDDCIQNESQTSYYNKELITELTTTMISVNSFAVFAIYKHLLLDTGAPKSICCVE